MTIHQQPESYEEYMSGYCGCLMCKHEHIFTIWCQACGKAAPEGLCRTCGPIGDAPRQCEFCGVDEKDIA